jgi:hypothetical protein
MSPILSESLLAGGVPVGRATALAASLNTCIRFGVERVLSTPLSRSVRAGRFRVTVHDTTGAPVSLARVGGRGKFTAASECQDAQGARVTPIDRRDNLIVCNADANGRSTFIVGGGNTPRIDPGGLVCDLGGWHEAARAGECALSPDGHLRRPGHSPGSMRRRQAESRNHVSRFL